MGFEVWKWLFVCGKCLCVLIEFLDEVVEIVCDYVEGMVVYVELEEFGVLILLYGEEGLIWFVFDVVV